MSLRCLKAHFEHLRRPFQVDHHHGITFTIERMQVNIAFCCREQHKMKHTDISNVLINGERLSPPWTSVVIHPHITITNVYVLNSTHSDGYVHRFHTSGLHSRSDSFQPAIDAIHTIVPTQLNVSIDLAK